MSAELSALNLIRHAGEPTTEAYLERPSPWGWLRLDVLDFDRVPDSAHTPAETAEADRALRRADHGFDPDRPELTVAAMREITRRWPLWVGGHGGSFTVLQHIGREEEALFHLRQAIAVLPERSLVFKLQHALRKVGRPEESAVIGEQLWSERARLDDDVALQVAIELVMALGMVERSERAVRVATEAMEACGPNDELVVHRVLNLLRCGRVEDATAAWADGAPHVPAASLVRGTFDALGQMLGGVPRA